MHIIGLERARQGGPEWVAKSVSVDPLSLTVEGQPRGYCPLPAIRHKKLLGEVMYRVSDNKTAENSAVQAITLRGPRVLVRMCRRPGAHAHAKQIPRMCARASALA